MHEQANRLPVCPQCSLRRGPGLRYCAACQFDFDRPPVPATPAVPALQKLTAASAIESPEGGSKGVTGREDRSGQRMNGPALGMVVVGIAGAAGALLAWVTVAIPGGHVMTRSGVEAGLIGLLALTSGAALAMAGLARAFHAGSLALAQAVGLVGAIALIGSFAFGFFSTDAVARTLVGANSGVAGVGVGLFLVLVAGVAGIVFDGFVSTADA